MSAYLAINPARHAGDIGWLDQAPCAGLSDLFDVPVYRDIAEAFRAAQPALDICSACPFTRQCMERVDPAGSLFDGVAAGRLWRNGAVAKRPARRGRDPEKVRENNRRQRARGTDSWTRRKAENALIRAAGRPVEVDLLAIKDAAIHRCDCGAWRFATQSCTTCTPSIAEAS